MGTSWNEKTTAEIIEDVKTALLSAESFCDKYRAGDITACLYADVMDIQSELDEGQYAGICAEVEKSREALQESFNAHDVTSSIACLDRMIEIYNELPSKDVVQRKNYDEAYERHRIEETVVVLGDSHVNFFSGNEKLTLLPIGNGINVSPQINGFPFTALHLGSCLAYNSNMYGSTEGFLEKLDFLMEHFITKGSKVVVSLGEIDIRCHVFKQTQLQSRSYEAIVDDILENFFDMLLYVKEHDYDVYVWGPIASQIDKCPIGEYLPRVGSEEDRNKATRYFTVKAMERCNWIGIGFASLFEEMIDENLRTRESFICEDMCHLTQGIYDLAIKEWERSGILR